MTEPMNFLEEILLDGEARKLSDGIIKFLGEDLEQRDPYVVMTAIEYVLCHLMSLFDEEEHFPILSSLLHNTAIKLYEKEMSKDDE